MIRLIDANGNAEMLSHETIRRRILNYYGSIAPARFLASSKSEILTHFANTDLSELLTEYQKLCASGVEMKHYDR